MLQLQLHQRLQKDIVLPKKTRRALFTTSKTLELIETMSLSGQLSKVLLYYWGILFSLQAHSIQQMFP